MNIQEAIAELRKNEKKKFEQTIDLIINLKGIDAKKDNIATIVTVPHVIKDKKVCGFFTKKSALVDTITQPEFVGYRDKKPLKVLVKKYDFFIASAKLMPSIATTFGKVLGPAGKMPSPQLGVVMQEEDNVIKALVEKISKSIKVRIKESSAKVAVAREGMSDKDIEENIRAVYEGIVNALPTKKENVKNVMVKFTMTKPVKVEMK